MPASAELIRRNLQQVRERMAAAAERSGRSVEQVRLVAVTKYVDVTIDRLLVESGCLDLGESRPQQLWAKAAALQDLPVRWHLVGHLQRNKARRTLPHLHYLHSVDSMRLLQTVNDLLAESSHSLSALIEVNISGEPAKHGFAADQLEEVVEQASRYSHLKVRGLMAMAGLEGDASEARRQFAQLRQLRDQLLPRCPTAVELDELSMGMSGDFEIAIEEGATIVRVGSALFEGVL